MYELLYWCLACWFVICLIRACRHRDNLYDRHRLHATGHNETCEVKYRKHVLYLVFFRDPIQLYGPYVQIALKNSHTVFDRRWWKVYNDIYCLLSKPDQKRVKRLIFRGSSLESAIFYATRIDIDYLIDMDAPQVATEHVFSMLEAADEYEQIILMQDKLTT